MINTDYYICSMPKGLYNFILIAYLSLSASAQRTIAPTDSFKIEGIVKNEKVYTITSLDSFVRVAIKDQIIYNHKGEIKDTLTGLKGVLLKTILNTTEPTIYHHRNERQVYEKSRSKNCMYFNC
ncbi:MAG: hypothetical protein HYZ42_05965 [Bacteroidetes bacterium]|nr:hypothetical protein [Bacteroidota bacterium]